MAKPTRQQSVDYTVQNNDTLERIAARHDCTPSELMKLNRLSSRMVFAGQRILIPSPSLTDAAESPNKPPERQPSISTISMTYTGPIPGTAFPLFDHPSIHRPALSNPLPSTPKPLSKSLSLHPSHPQSVDESDVECLQKFLKLSVKHFTSSEGCINGTLLITPNCVMFDPDLSHPLVKENGSERYSMMAKMDDIVSAAMYKDISAMTCSEEKNLYSSEDSKRDERSEEILFTPVPLEDIPEMSSPQKPSRLIDAEEKEKLENLLHLPQGVNSNRTLHLSDTELDQISPPKNRTPPKGSYSSLPMEESDQGRKQDRGRSLRGRFSSLQDSIKSSPATRKKAFHSNLSASGSGEKEEEQDSHRLLKFSRSLSQKGRRIGGAISSGAVAMGGAVVTGATSVTGAIATGAQQVGGVVVSGAHTAKDALQTGAASVGDVLQTGAANVGDALQTGAHTLAAVPRNIVNIGSGLFADEDASASPSGGLFYLRGEYVVAASDSVNGELRDELALRKQKSYLKLEELLHKSKSARVQASNSLRAQLLASQCATKQEEKPGLFSPPVEEMLAGAGSGEMPYFLCVRLNAKRLKEKRQHFILTHQQTHEDAKLYSSGEIMRTEFWFTLPKEKASSVYLFFAQCSPEKYGAVQEREEQEKETIAKLRSAECDRNFLIIDSLEADEKLRFFTSLRKKKLKF